MVGPEAGEEILDRSERHGFAGDLGESFGASLDGDEAVAVDRDDIARVIPAVRDRFDHAWILGPIVTKHDVGPTYEEPGPVLDAGHGLEARLDEGQEPANGPAFDERRRIDGDHRRRLGDAIAFENGEAELLHVKAPRLRLHRLRARDNVSERREGRLVGVASVVGQECVRAEEESRLRLVDGLGDLAIVQGSGIESDLH
jgi:hypothetical protein